MAGRSALSAGGAARGGRPIALYESTRGVVAGRRDIALRHAEDVVSIERSLHMFVEGGVERAAERVSGLTSALGVLYLSLHLALTGLLLIWLHQRRRHAYPFFRTMLLAASADGLIGYLTFPTAPPRLSVPECGPRYSRIRSTPACRKIRS
jgi:PAP2 superfamily